MHNKCNVLESSPNHFPYPRSVEKLSFTKLVPGAKKVGDCCPKGKSQQRKRGLKIEEIDRGTISGQGAQEGGRGRLTADRAGTPLP